MPRVFVRKTERTTNLESLKKASEQHEKHGVFVAIIIFFIILFLLNNKASWFRYLLSFLEIVHIYYLGKMLKALEVKVRNVFSGSTYPSLPYRIVHKTFLILICFDSILSLVPCAVPSSFHDLFSTVSGDPAVGQSQYYIQGQKCYNPRALLQTHSCHTSGSSQRVDCPPAPRL